MVVTQGKRLPSDRGEVRTGKSPSQTNQRARKQAREIVEAADMPRYVRNVVLRAMNNGGIKEYLWGKLEDSLTPDRLKFLEPFKVPQ